MLPARTAMAELEIDQSNLPRVREVCQGFAVLEDGALAHNLQEQEIEQYYTSNVQKNQLVQRDIRIARRLQDEERDRLQNLSRQREEQDSEYARLVQEELQRGAEEACRREVEDQEIAKRIQEEEDVHARRRGSCHTSVNRDGTAAPGLSYSPHPGHAWARERERPHHHWRPLQGSHPPSPSPSPSPPPSDSDQQLERYPGDRPPRQRARPSPVVGPAEAPEGYPFSGGWAGALRLIKQDMSEQGYVSCSSEEELPASPLRRLERVVLSGQQGDATERHMPNRRSSFRGDGRMWETQGGEARRGSGYSDERGWRTEPRGLRHSASVRYSSTGDCQVARPLERVSSWASRDSGDRRVHFQDDRRHYNSYHGNGSRVCEGSRGGFRERGDVVSYCGDPRLAGSGSRSSQTCSSIDDYHQQRVPPLQRNTFARRSYQGDGRQNRRRSFRDIRNDDYHGNGSYPEDRPRHRENSFSNSRCIPEENGREPEVPGLRCERAAWERRSCRGYGGQRGHLSSPRHEVPRENPGARRWHSERREVRHGPSQHWHGQGEDGFSSGEVGVLERRADAHPTPSQRPADAGVPSRAKGAPLAMGALQQVLLDEELARRLQEQEEEVLARSPRPSSPPGRPYIDKDFRVAQVAQDEEIARFMQKQEIKTNHGLSEADAPRSSSDTGDSCMADPCNQNSARQRQRERLDSQGLPSPPDDYPPDEQPPSPVVMAAQQQLPARNIAEELDPTFLAKRKESLRLGSPGTGVCERLPQAQSSCYTATVEPAFVPPTKRPNEKLGRAKAKEKKESAKQKENCKQQ